MKAIVSVPHQVLATTAAPVTEFDAKLVRLIDDMKATLLATTNPRGVGLAAPQVGVSLRLFITKPSQRTNIRAFINPEIVRVSDDAAPRTHKDAADEKDSRDGKLEGCLSIPKIWGNVHRAKSVTLRYQDEKGSAHQETFTGFHATIVQHETDHINGILFTQRVLEQKGKLYQIAYDEDGKEILDEIKI